MYRKIVLILKDNSGTGEMIACLIKLLFTLTVGSVLVAFLKSVLSTSFTGMMDSIKSLVSSGF